jgi:two-component system OmpR family response regulator
MIRQQYLLSHTEDEIRQTVREIEDGGGKAVALVADVADAAAMERAIGDNLSDLVVLDLMLPGDDGLKLCRELRSPAFGNDKAPPEDLVTQIPP